MNKEMMTDNGVQNSPLPEFIEKVEKTIEDFRCGVFGEVSNDLRVRYYTETHANCSRLEYHLGSACTTIIMTMNDNASGEETATEKLSIVMVTPFDDRKAPSRFNEEVHVVVLANSLFPTPIYQKTAAQYRDLFVSVHLPKILHQRLNNLYRELGLWYDPNMGTVES